MQPASPPPSPPAQASGRIEPARQGAIATPSVRADLAKKDERGQGVGVGGSNAQGVSGGTISGTTSNNPSANRSISTLTTNGRKAQAVSPQPAPRTADEKTRSRKSMLQDEAKAKKEAQTTDTERANVHEDDRDKQKVPRSVAQSVSVATTSESVEVTSGIVTPAWRVGRRGLIQKLNEKGKWKKQKSGVKADLYSSAFPSLDTGWAVGQAGTILRTTDGGTTWSQLPSPTTVDLIQVTATNNQAATVVTRGGQTFNTIDGGTTWSTAKR
jgi:photosynthesis system II assembly factor YCF48-like protein